MEMRSERLSSCRFHEGQKLAGKRVSDGWSKASYDDCCHPPFLMLGSEVENDVLEADRVVPLTYLLRTIDEISSPCEGLYVRIHSYMTKWYICQDM